MASRREHGQISPSAIEDAHKPDEQTFLLDPDDSDEPVLPQHTTEPDTESSLDQASPNAAKKPGHGERPTSSSPTGIAGMISILLLGVFIANADGSIMLATYGVISSEVGSLDDASWLVVTYTLAMCAIQPMYGKLSEIYGRKSMLNFAYSLFGIGCALCGFGRSTSQIILGRVVAGLGGAGMTSLVSILIADKVPLRDIATWRSYVNMAATIGRSAGGPFGGYLADTIGWRWSFYIQCPLALISIILVSWRLDSPARSSEDTGAQSHMKRLRRIDFAGSISLALTIVGLLLALDLGGQKLSWGHPLVWILFVSSLGMGVLFLLVEAYWAKEPVFPLRLLVHRDVITAYLVTGLQVAAQFAVMYTVPLYFQVTARTSVTNAGFHLLPAVLGNTVGGLMSGYIIKRTAEYKLLTSLATIISTSAYILLVVFWHGHTNIWQSLFIAPGGFGTGIVLATTFVALTAGIEKAQIPVASTGLYVSSNIGALTGASLASTILRSTMTSELETRLKGVADWKYIAEKASSDLKYVESLEGRIRENVVESYVHGFTFTYEFSIICSATAFVIALFMRQHSLR